jgi:hypothetical protein
MMSLPAELDRNNVVNVDLGSADFKANAHRHMAEWARRRPFYVLGNGPPHQFSLAGAWRKPTHHSFIRVTPAGLKFVLLDRLLGNPRPVLLSVVGPSEGTSTGE